jgi:hypothetical protein
MLKRSMIAACVLALSAGSAFAGDNWMTNWIPPGPNDAPGGANGAAHTRDVGVTSANVNETGDSRTTSSSMLEQRLKKQSAAGVSNPAYNIQPDDQYRAQAWGSDRPAQTYRGRSAYIIDEYGFKYDSRGNRIN